MKAVLLDLCILKMNMELVSLLTLWVGYGVYGCVPRHCTNADVTPSLNDIFNLVPVEASLQPISDLDSMILEVLQSAMSFRHVELAQNH